MENKTVNPRRRKQILQFLDKEHKVIDKYYEILEKHMPFKKLILEMSKLIKEDPDFYDPYLVICDIFGAEGKTIQARKLILEAYQRALNRIVDKEGNFPKEMIWGWLDNRHIIRLIDRYASELWEQGETEKALEIFRNLLKSNPNDNIGARYSILAIRLGLGTDYEKQFATKDMLGYLDGFKISNWFSEHRKKFPDEFEQWFSLVEKENK
ncbi:TPA: tetratricopeptide repeat protein [Candidatus Woesearchaeota archaeon]|nr:tetratricopeptide repeat protein [Candidatus Woesearchaeota archaeon]